MWNVAEAICTYILYCILLYILSVNLLYHLLLSPHPPTAVFFFIIYDING